MFMNIRPNEFITNIDYDGQSYTPLNLLEYVKETNGEGYADKTKINDLKASTNNQIHKIMDKHNLTLHQILTKKGSKVGESLTKLVMEHEVKIYNLIQKGEPRQEVLI